MLRSTIWFLIFFMFILFLRERERDRQSVSRGGAERKEDRI